MEGKYYLVWKLILTEIERSTSVNFSYGLFYLPSLWNMVFAFSKTHLLKNKAVLWFTNDINKTETKVMYSIKSQWQCQKEYNHTIHIYIFLSHGFANTSTKVYFFFYFPRVNLGDPNNCLLSFDFLFYSRSIIKMNIVWNSSSDL